MSPPQHPPVTFLPLGDTIQSFTLASQNLVLNFPTEDLYRSHNTPHFGETIGRICNRLSDGRICGLNGRDYDLAKNEGGITTLHGGVEGWGRKIWDGPMRVRRGGREVVGFVLRSKDGDEGFPGEVEARVWYHVKQQEGGSVILDVEYEVEMVGDEPEVYETVVAMKNHSYFNIGDGITIAGTRAKFGTNLCLTMDSRGIPTGDMETFPGLTTDRSIVLGPDSPAIDHCFVLEPDTSRVPLDTRSNELRLAVELYHPSTSLHLRVETTEPSFQFYTGDGIDVPEVWDRETGMRVPARRARSGLAIEPNRYVNAVNQGEWRKMVLLERGRVWGSRSRYHAWVG